MTGVFIVGIVVFVLSVISLTLYDAINYGFFDWDEIVPSIGKSLLVTIIYFCLMFFVSMFPETEEFLQEEKEIYALKDNNAVSGNFFLASGNISEEPYYFFIEGTERGKIMNKISVDNSYLNEGAYKPHIKVYGHRYISDVWNWMFAEAWGTEVYEFYIPEGTVTTDFNVNME